MSMGYTKHPNIITQAQSKAIQPWHFRMPHTMTTHRPFRSLSEQQVYSNTSAQQLISTARLPPQLKRQPNYSLVYPITAQHSIRDLIKVALSPQLGL